MAAGLLVAFLIFGGWLSYSFGQDTNWDLENYHFYNAWSFVAGRLDTDLFAANTQTYFSPIIDLPYYFLSTAWLKFHPGLLGFVMGLPFGILLFVSFQVCWVVSKPYFTRSWVRLLACFAATAFGNSGVAVVIQIGATFNEIPIAALVVAGLWLLLLHASDSAVWNRKSQLLVFASGLLFGTAAALKFTSGIYAPGAAALCLLLPGRLNLRLVRAILFCLAWLVMVALIWGPWGAQVYHLTGNPLFPMFNDVFHSNWTAPTGGRDLHAMPHGVIQWVFYPFYWIALNTTVMELSFSDSRYAIVFVLVIFLLAAALVARLSRAKPNQVHVPPGIDRTTSVAIVAYVVISYVLWETVFSILRYTASLESITGAIVLIFFGNIYCLRQLPKLAKAAALALVVLVCSASIYFTVCPSYGRIPFGKTVWNVEAPALPAGSTIIFANAPMAFVAPFIAKQTPGVSFISLPSSVDNSAWQNFQFGKKVRDRIAGASNLYVAYYQNALLPMDRLADFGVAADFHSCGTISSNISLGMTICAAHRVDPESARVQQKFAIEPILISPPGPIDVSLRFSGGCTSSTLLSQPQIATIQYKAFPPHAHVRIWLRMPPGQNILLGNGPDAWTLKEGPWFTGGEHIIFTDLNGNRLEEYILQYTPCN